MLISRKTAKKTNEWVHYKAGIKRELVNTVKAWKLAHYDHTVRKQGSCLELQGTMPATRRRGRPHSLAGQHQIVDRTTRGRVNQNDRGQVNLESTSMVWPTLGLRMAEEQNRTKC